MRAVLLDIVRFCGMLGSPREIRLKGIVIMNNKQRIEALRKLTHFLSGELEKLKSAQHEACDNFGLNQFKAGRREYSKARVVSTKIGYSLAKKYGMTQSGEIGKHISSLKKVDYVNLNFEDRFDFNRAVVLIFACAILYGEHAYLMDLDKQEKFPQTKKIALNMLSEDVDLVHENLALALDGLKNREKNQAQNNILKVFHSYADANTDFDGDFRLHNINELYDLCKDFEKNKQKIYREKYHMIDILEHGFGRPLFHLDRPLSESFKDGYGRELYLNYHWSNDWHTKYLLKIVLSLKTGISDNYLIAPGINLWVNKVLEGIDNSISIKRKDLAKEKQMFDKKLEQVAGYYDNLNLSPDILKYMRTIKRRNK